MIIQAIKDIIVEILGSCMGCLTMIVVLLVALFMLIGAIIHSCNNESVDSIPNNEIIIEDTISTSNKVVISRPVIDPNEVTKLLKELNL